MFQNSSLMRYRIPRSSLFSARWASTLVVVEHDGQVISPSSLRILDAASRYLPGALDVCIATSSPSLLETISRIKHVRRTFMMNCPEWLRNKGVHDVEKVPEILAPWILRMSSP